VTKIGYNEKQLEG